MYLCFTLLCLAYPSVADNCMRMIDCASFPSGGPPKLVFNSYYTCFEGDHTLPAVLGIVTIAIYCVLFPLAIFLRLNYNQFALRKVQGAGFSTEDDVDTVGREEKEEALRQRYHRMIHSARYQYFYQNSYKPRTAWFHCVRMMVLFTFSLLNAFGSNLAQLLLGLVVLMLLSSLYKCFAPYTQASHWKHRVKMLSILLTGLGSITKYICAEVGESLPVLAIAFSIVTLVGCSILLPFMAHSYLCNLKPEADVGSNNDSTQQGSVELSVMANPMHENLNNSPLRLQPHKQELEEGEDEDEDDDTTDDEEDKGSSWVAHVDPGTGKTYYYHTKTQETRWIKPSRAHNTSASTSSAAWKPILDRNSGRYYEWNEETGETRWSSN